LDAGDVARFVRPATLPAVAAGVAGGAVAASGGPPDSYGRLAAALASSLLLTGASNGLNQIADVATDRINRPHRPLPSGRLGRREAWWLVASMTVAALLAAALVNAAYLACVAATVPVTAAYSLPPTRTKRLPFLANATIATPRGLLLVVAGWAAGGGLDRLEAWVLGALAWLYVFGAATTKDFADVEGDRATGCTTLPILLGARRAALFVAPFLVAPFLAYPVCASAGWLPGGVRPWLALGGGLALVGAAAAVLLVRSPSPPEGKRAHPAWALMYLQLTAAHAGAAVVFVSI